MSNQKGFQLKSQPKYLDDDKQLFLCTVSETDNYLDCVQLKNLTAGYKILTKIQSSVKQFNLQFLEKLNYLDVSIFNAHSVIRPYYKQVYDLKISKVKGLLNKQRLEIVRASIIQFLDEKHKQFLHQLGIDKFEDEVWHPDFNPKNYGIPRLTLQSHPETQATELKIINDNKTDLIKIPKVKQEQNVQVRPFTSKQASILILTGKGYQVSKRLNESIKYAQQLKKKYLLQQLLYNQRQKTIIPETLQQISQKVYQIYLGRSVQNICKPDLIKQVKIRINNKFGDLALNRHMEYLIQLKQVGFLKQFLLRDKTVIWKMSCKKYKNILEHVLELKKQKLLEIAQQ